MWTSSSAPRNSIARPITWTKSFAGKREKIVDVETEAGSEATIKEHLLPGQRGQRTRRAGHRFCQHHARLQSILHLLHRAVHTRGGTQPDDTGHRGGMPAIGGNGVKEITLLGQIVTSYGKRDLPVQDGKSGFVQLLTAVHEIDGLERIRFTSPHPKGYGDDLAAAYGQLPKLCESAHLPAQSGSDRILKGDASRLHARAVSGHHRKIAPVQPRMGITTDIIVGFPGETEEDFAQTLSLAREAQFDNAYLFKYSPRKDTPAAAMPDQVPDAVKEERHARLLEEINAIGRRRYKRARGGNDANPGGRAEQKESARLMGRTRCNKIVIFEGSDRHRGQLMDLKIERAGSFTLYGDPAILNCPEVFTRPGAVLGDISQSYHHLKYSDGASNMLPTHTSSENAYRPK
jgi:tRNA-2-methylthio-N6-dimethylallyladenosine synthase